MPKHRLADTTVADEADRAWKEDHAWEGLLGDCDRMARALWFDACACSGPEGSEPPKVFVGVVSGALRGALAMGRDHARAFGR